MRVIATIATREQAPSARLLAWSLRAHDPLARLVVLLLDDRHHDLDPSAEPFAVVRPSSLGLARFELLAAMHEPRELALAVQPALLRHLLSHEGEPVLFLGIDTQVFADTGPVFALTAQHPLVLVPRIQAPVPRDRVRRDDAAIMAMGVFDQGCVAVAPGTGTDAFLQSWNDRLEADPARGLPLSAGRFLDLAPGMVAGTRITLDPGMGVSAMNLHERQLTRQGGRLMANREPVTVLHHEGLSGVQSPAPDPFGGAVDRAELEEETRLGAIRAAAQRALVARHAELAALVAERDRRLTETGREEAARHDYGYNSLGPGLPLNRRLRRWVRDAAFAGALRGSPFTATGLQDLMLWLNVPGPQGAAAGITRYWYGIYRERADLQATFPDLDGSDGIAMASWAREVGAADYVTPQLLLPDPV